MLDFSRRGGYTLVFKKGYLTSVEVELEGGVLSLLALKPSLEASGASEGASVVAESIGRIGASSVGSWGLAGEGFSSGVGFWGVFWSSGGIDRLYQKMSIPR